MKPRLLGVCVPIGLVAVQACTSAATAPAQSIVPATTVSPVVTPAPGAVDVSQVARTILAYGEGHRDEFCVVYIDRDRNVVVALFTAHLDDHEAALRARLGPAAEFEVVQARVTEDELIALQERIVRDDWDALRELGIFIVESGTDLARGLVRLGISTERDDAEAVLRSRYGPDIAVEVMDPTGAFLKPRGTIVLSVVDQDGKPLEAFIGWNPLFAEIPLDALARFTDPRTGQLVLDETLPGRWTLTATVPGYRSGSVEVDLLPGESVEASIVLQLADG